MLSATTAYKNAIKSTDREMRGYLRFNGSTNLRGVDGLISIKWTQELADEERFTVGNAVSSYIEASFFNAPGIDLSSAYVEAFVGVVTSYATSRPSGSIENDNAVVAYMPLGRFNISEVTTAKNVTSIVAYDALSGLSKDYVPTVSPSASGYAIRDIVNDVLLQSGVGGSVTGNYGYVTEIESGTCREQLGWCLSMMVSNGSNYIMNRSNNTIKMTSVVGQAASQYTIDDTTTYMDGLDDKPAFTIASLQATTGDDVYSFGSGTGVSISNPYITSAQAQAIYNALNGFSYTPVELEFRGDPRIDAGDVFTLTSGNNTYTCVAMRIESQFDGGFKSKIFCYGDSELYYEMAKSPTGTRIVQAENMIRIEAARAQGEENRLSAAITVNSEAIAAEVTRATGAESSLSSQITQTAENITSTVSETYQTKADASVVNIMPSIYYRESLSGAEWINNGITWTVNPDGSVTATGTATGNSTYSIANSSLSASVPAIKVDHAKKYTISGTPQVIGCRLCYAKRDASGAIIGSEGYIMSAASSVISSGAEYISTYMYIVNGTALPSDGVTFKPMLEAGSTAHGYVSTHNGAYAMQSQIIQNAKDISLRVEESDYNGKTIASLINQSASTVQIEAQHINLTGAVTISSLSTALASQVNGALSGSVTCYYRSTTSSTPAKPTAAVTSTAANTSGAWTLVMPRPLRGCYFWECVQYTASDGTVTWSTVRQMANATYTSLWCSSSNQSYIDGGSIYAHSVTADQIAAQTITADRINMTDLFSQNITATNMNITGGSVYIDSSDSSATLIKLNAPTQYVSMNSYGFYMVTSDNKALFSLNPIEVLSGAVSTNMVLYQLDNTTRENTELLNVSPSGIRARELGTSRIVSLYGSSGLRITDGTNTFTYDAPSGLVMDDGTKTYSFGTANGLSMYDGTKTYSFGTANGLFMYAGSSKYSALIWPDSNGAGRLVLGDGTSTKWRTELTNSGLVFRDASDAVTASYEGNRADKVVTVSGSSMSVASATSGATSLCSITLGAGLWVILCNARLGTSANGYRYIALSTSSTSMGAVSHSATVLAAPASGNQTQISFPAYVNVSASTTYYLNVRQNSGSAITCTGYIDAIKIA